LEIVQTPYACEAECPKGISVSNIARMNREFLGAGLGAED
jgi:succinate dehydrogenase / fumarate reductase iron-sulfur subunit